MNFLYRNVLPLFLLACLLVASSYSQQEANHTLPVPNPAAVAPAAETVEQLIAQAEAEYARGLSNYAAGHLEAAKDNFDAAFNLLLRGPVTLQNDERLQAEFDKIVEATQDLEMQALKVGDGFTEQRFEPAPIDEVNNITFPVDPTIKAKAQAELASTHSDLPLMLTDPVASYINYFSSRGHGTIERALARRGRYSDMISRVFREEGVPQDLMFLAQAESGFQPLALSRMGARGMWQFMPWDGQHAGLQRNWWVDERQDPEKATRAAARLLRDLFSQFGDWYLAMAAYNSGPGTVQRAVQRTGYADFWELYRRDVLPEETRNYVPIILAMTIMAKNPSQYGLDHIPIDPSAASDTVRIHYPIDLRLVAECIDSSTTVLQELNPSLLRMTTPKDMDFDLHLPVGTAEKFQKTVAAIPEEMRVYWRYHRVESGETLTEIARRYHTTASTIAEANNLQGDDLAQDSRLIIPVSPAKSASSEVEGNIATVQRYSKQATHYKVHRGDTISSVADEFGISAEKLRQWNRCKGDVLPAGQTLTIFKPASEATVKPLNGTGSRWRVRTGTARVIPQREPHGPARGVGQRNSRNKAGERAASAQGKEKAAGPARAAAARGRKRRPQG
ncbi:MAG: transglycosylase SLT domain-containing protein [Candidatus Korobacteraceae bacterium]